MPSKVLTQNIVCMKTVILWGKRCCCWISPEVEKFLFSSFHLMKGSPDHFVQNWEADFGLVEELHSLSEFSSHFFKKKKDKVNFKRVIWDLLFSSFSHWFKAHISVSWHIVQKLYAYLDTSCPDHVPFSIQVNWPFNSSPNNVDQKRFPSLLKMIKTVAGDRRRNPFDPIH